MSASLTHSGLHLSSIFCRVAARHSSTRGLVQRRHVGLARPGRSSMGAVFSSSSPPAFSSSSQPDFTSMIEQKNKENPIMVYSKTYCPFCSEVKGLFERLNVPVKVVELDNLADGAQVQAALSKVSGMRTVPQVFVGGQLVGGCDDTVAAMNSGKLKEMMQAAGISA